MTSPTEGATTLLVQAYLDETRPIPITLEEQAQVVYLARWHDSVDCLAGAAERLLAQSNLADRGPRSSIPTPRFACQACTESRGDARGTGQWTHHDITHACEACGGTGYRPAGQAMELTGPRTGASTIGTIQAEWGSMAEKRIRGEV